MNLPKTKQWATAYATKEFISVNTCSGLRRYVRDPEGVEFFFPCDISEEQLGEGVLKALSVSRFLSPDELGYFFDLKRIEKNYEDWVNLISNKFGYKSRKDIFKEMKHCMIECVDGVITIKPTNHEKLEGWSGKGIDTNCYEVVKDISVESDIGKALKQCFTKCL